MRNLIFEEKRRNFRFLKFFLKSLPFSTDISWFLRIRWDWETKNSRKIGETLRLKNSVKNRIFSPKNFYFNRIQQNWEHDNFEKITGTLKLGNFESLIFVSQTKLLIQRFLLTKHTSRTNSEGNIFFCIFLMIINFRSIHDKKIWETWDLKNYVINFIFSPNNFYFLRIQQNWGHDNFEKIEKLKKSFETFRQNLEKSQIFSFFALRIARVLFENRRISEKWWGKR